MTISFTQTDTNATCGVVYCSARSLNSTTSLKQVAEGGTPGITEVTQTIDGSASVLIVI